MIILTTIDTLFMNFSFGKKYSTVVKIPVGRSLHIIFKFLRALHDWLAPLLHRETNDKRFSCLWEKKTNKQANMTKYNAFSNKLNECRNHWVACVLHFQMTAAIAVDRLQVPSSSFFYCSFHGKVSLLHLNYPLFWFYRVLEGFTPRRRLKECLLQHSHIVGLQRSVTYLTKFYFQRKLVANYDTK